MLISFDKYHALGNDFLVVDNARQRLSKKRLGQLAFTMCNRTFGVGADGMLSVTSSRIADRKINVYNADGSWAEKSGNGLRIAAAHEYRNNKKKKIVCFDMAGEYCTAKVLKKHRQGYLIHVELGEPVFEAAEISVNTGKRYIIQSPLKLGGRNFPVTYLSVGNPHTVLIVDNFDFDWQTLGAEIENHKNFPKRTNVEFVRIVNRRKIHVTEWERGAGATGSSGTGAAAAVCAAVMIGLTERNCEVVFTAGSLFVHWRSDTNIIELTGPAEWVCQGIYKFQ